jgi:hypothetical protein
LKIIVHQIEVKLPVSLSPSSGERRSPSRSASRDLDWLERPGGSVLGVYPDELLTDADIPRDELDCDFSRDPEDTTSRPAELEGLTEEDLDRLSVRPPGRRIPPPWPLSYQDSGDPGGPAGFLPRDGSDGGCGFADGGVLDTLRAGVALAGFAADADAQTETLNDDSLIGVLRAWRRLTSWAQAHELATVAELARRRPADGTPPAAGPGEFPREISKFLEAELAAALTLTAPAAESERGLALDLAGRAATWRALEAGWIDLPRASLITMMLSPLAAEHADAVEAGILPRAGDMTTAQLRRALHRAVLKIDPQAAQKRREQAEQTARVEQWIDPEGTATLAGRNLPPAQTLAASRRLTQIAAAWKGQGAQGGMDLLRAHAYLALLNGLDTAAPPASLLTSAVSPSAVSPSAVSPAAVCPAAVSPPGEHVPAGLRCPGGPDLPPTAGIVNLTIPLTTLLRLSEAPGEAAGHGPLDAATARLLACAVAGHRASRWQITVTSPAGLALAHGAARGPASPDGGGAGWKVSVTAEPIAAGHCDHRHKESGYRPGPALQRLVRARSRTCSAHGCGRQAARCDLDHTAAYDDGGITCECNLAPLCRYHHQVKQADGWKLEQISPGVMAWLTPAGRRYVTIPSEHPT